MKCKINGIEIEGEVSEILELVEKKGIVSKPEPEHTIEPELCKPYRKRRKRKFETSYQERCKKVAEEFIRLNGRKKINRLVEKIMKRGMGGTDSLVIRKWVKKLGYDDQELKKNNKRKIKPDSYVGTRKRMTFIQSRIKSLTSTYGYDYHKAFKVASDEYNQNKLGKVKSIEEVTPTIIPDKIKNAVLLGMIKNMSYNKKPLNYINDGNHICDNYKEWNNIMVKIMSKQTEINKYVGTDKKLKLHKAGNYQELNYI